MKILIIVGSLRKDSINKVLAKALVGCGAEMDFEIADISNIPLYNGDLEASFPAEATELKNKIKSADGVIIVTPEYNRSIPGVLKNALDWTSRPYGDNAWDKKPVAIAGATGGAIGTANAQAHLRPILIYLNTHLMGQPEMYVGSFATRVDPSGKILDPKTEESFKNFLQKFKEHIEIFK